MTTTRKNADYAKAATTTLAAFAVGALVGAVLWYVPPFIAFPLVAVLAVEMIWPRTSKERGTR